MIDHLLIAVFILSLAKDASANSYQLTILHTNDGHSRFEQINSFGGQCSDKDRNDKKCFGGVARRFTKLKELRSKETNVLLLDAGDQFQGTFWFNFLKGRGAANFMNKLGYDAMAFGNHEFDLGIDGIIPFVKNVTFPVLSCNIDASLEPGLAPLFNKSAVFDRGGQKIGVIGYTSKETPFLSSPGKLKFLDEAESIQKEVDKLTAQGINKIIAVGHSGYIVDLNIAKKVRGVDVLVGGHSNTFLFSGTQPSVEPIEGPYPTVVEQSDGAKVLIVQDYAYGKYLGRLNVRFDETGHVQSWTGNPILLDSSVAEDPAIRDEVNRTKALMGREMFKVIGRSAVFLNATKPYCRRGECNLGNMLTDALVYRNLADADSPYWSKASIAVWNSGGIRTSISKGPITLSNLLDVAPFQNTIDVITVNGSTLWKILEHSVSDYEQEDGRFLQMSGLIATYNVKKPIGQRLVSVKVRCADCAEPVFQPLDEAKFYKIILPDFLIDGGDYFSMIKPNLLKREVAGVLDTDILMQYVKVRNPVLSAREERIRYVEEDTIPTCKPQITSAGSVIVTEHLVPVFYFLIFLVLANLYRLR